MFGTARILRRPRWRWRVALALVCAAGAVTSVWSDTLVMRAGHRGLPRECDKCLGFDPAWRSPEFRQHLQRTTILFPSTRKNRTPLRDPALPIELHYMEGWFVILTTQAGPSSPERVLDLTYITVCVLGHSRGVAWPVRAAIPGRKGVYLVAVWLPPFVLLTVIGFAPLVSGSVRTLRMGHRRRRGRCTACGYSLAGLSEQRCPECGTPAGVGNAASA